MKFHEYRAFGPCQNKFTAIKIRALAGGLTLLKVADRGPGIGANGCFFHLIDAEVLKASVILCH